MEKYVIIRLDDQDEYDAPLINKVSTKDFETLHEIPMLTQEQWVRVLHEVVFDRIKERKNKDKINL